MKLFRSIRLWRIFWVVALAVWIADMMYPISDRMTRTAGVLLLFTVWFGLIGLCWRRPVFRNALIGITILCGGFLSMPSRGLPNSSALRRDYVSSLRRYEGVKYVWGGEGVLGIDCSGLIRRGLVDAMFCRGLRTFDGALVRRSIGLWWNDTTAKALGEGRGGLTSHLLATPSIDVLDHSQLLPGDLAVTRSGVHVMAYVGDSTWIEADPGAGRVIRAKAPSQDMGWFQAPVNIMRWNVFR